MIGCNLSRFCLMIGEEPVDHPLKAVQLLQKMPALRAALIAHQANHTTRNKLEENLQAA
jgi:hypothetical protein